MSDLIERQKVIDALCSTCGDGRKNCPLHPYCGDIELINEVPTAVELIQCHECRFFLENWKCITWHMFVRPDGYCFRAERKPDADESV